MNLLTTTAEMKLSELTRITQAVRAGTMSQVQAVAALKAAGVATPARIKPMGIDELSRQVGRCSSKI